MWRNVGQTNGGIAYSVAAHTQGTCRGSSLYGSCVLVGLFFRELFRQAEHATVWTFQSTELSAVPAEVVDAKTSVHIFTSRAGPMDQLIVSGIMMLGSSRALWRHTYFYFIATSNVLHRAAVYHTLELIADFHVDLSVGIWAACLAGLATATQQPPTLHL